MSSIENCCLSVSYMLALLQFTNCPSLLLITDFSELCFDCLVIGMSQS